MTQVSSTASFFETVVDENVLESPKKSDGLSVKSLEKESKKKPKKEKTPKKEKKSKQAKRDIDESEGETNEVKRDLQFDDVTVCCACCCVNCGFYTNWDW